jgi:hypothetical protein
MTMTTHDLLNIASELWRLSCLPEHTWDDEDYAAQTACAVKLARIDRKIEYEYDSSWLMEDPDYEDALRDRR